MSSTSRKMPKPSWLRSYMNPSSQYCWTVSGDTHFLWLFRHLFLLTLHYLLLHLSILFLNNAHNHLWVSLRPVLTFPYLFLSFSDSTMDFTCDPYVYFYLHFLCYHVSPFTSSVRVTVVWLAETSRRSQINLLTQIITVISAPSRRS